MLSFWMSFFDQQWQAEVRLCGGAPDSKQVAKEDKEVRKCMILMHAVHLIAISGPVPTPPVYPTGLPFLDQLLNALLLDELFRSAVAS